MGCTRSPSNAATWRAAPSAVPPRPAISVDEARGEALEVEPLALDREAARAGRANGRPELIQEGRPPVRGHRHHLVLVRGAAEAEVLGHLLVEETERVRQLLRREDLQLTIRVAAREI